MSEDTKAMLTVIAILLSVYSVVIWATSHSNSRSDPQNYYSSKGYSCTSDCSGHNAGYDWAEENGVCDTSYDGGNSESFAEGVRSYAEDNC